MMQYFPSPYPNEIFYSVFARYISYLRYNDRNFAKSEIFQKSGISIYFPKNITDVYGKYQINSPSIETIINQHTLFPLLKVFLRPRDIYLNNLKDPFPGITISILSRYIINEKTYNLRFCKNCIEEDRKLYGEGYWHVMHQVPWINICHKHSILLYIFNYFNKKINQFISLEDALSTHNIKYALNNREIDFMIPDTIYLLNRDINVNFNQISQFIRDSIFNQGYLTSNSLISHRSLYNKIINSYHIKTIQFLYNKKSLSQKNLTAMVLQEYAIKSRAVATLVLSKLLGYTLKDIIMSCTTNQ